MRCPTLKELPPPPEGKTGWPWTDSRPRSPGLTIGDQSWPKVSIVMPNLNSDDLIEETIRSVVLQQYPNLEYIVVDGGSTDSSIKIIKKYEQWLDYWRSEPDRGIYDAYNKGIKIATGDWLYFIGSGDKLIDDVTIKDIFSLAQNADMIYGNVCLRRYDNIYAGKFSKWRLTEQNICHQAIFYHRRLFEKLGMFDMSHPYLADWVFNMRCFGDKRTKIIFFDRIIAFYKSDGQSYIHGHKDPLCKNRATLIRCYFGIHYLILFKACAVRKEFSRISKKIMKKIRFLINRNF